MSDISKESLLRLTDCDCSGVAAWANTVAAEAELQGMEQGAAEQMFRESLDEGCEGKIANPNSICEQQCSVPPMICGHEKGAHFLLKLALSSREDMGL